MTSTLLLLADGRTPTGGHAHSGGLEAAVASGSVSDARTLERWLCGRLETVGRVDAAFAAAWWALAGVGAAGSDQWVRLVGEYWARTPSAALRAASRAQARGLLRAGRAMWPGPAVEAATRQQAASEQDGGLPWAAALASVASDALIGLSDLTVAAASAAVTGPAWAATRLLGLDPYAVAACLARLSSPVEAAAASARCWGYPDVDPAALPAGSAPLLDIGAELHASWEVRLFAS